MRKIRSRANPDCAQSGLRWQPQIFAGWEVHRLPRNAARLRVDPRLALYDRATRQTTILTESFRNWADESRVSDSRTIYFLGPVEGRNPVFRLDIGSKQITQVLADKTIDASEFDRNESRLFYVKRGIGEPAEIYAADIVDEKASQPRQLSHFNDALMSEVDIRPAETIWVTGADGVRVQVFIVKPHGFDPSRKYPLILNVHGGPESNWSDAFRGDWQVYPGVGYVVAFPNPHGSTGFGQDYTAEIAGDFGGKVYEDLMKVTDALEKLPYVDKTRMGAMGWSYGGYMMMWFETHRSVQSHCVDDGYVRPELFSRRDRGNSGFPNGFEGQTTRFFAL